MINLQTISYFDSHTVEDSRFMRGQIVKNFQSQIGKSKATFYRHRDEFLKSNGVLAEKKHIMRMPRDRYLRIVKDCFVIALIMEGYHNCGANHAWQIAVQNNQLQELQNLSISQVRRYMDALGISNRKRKLQKASIRWVADYSNQIIMVDASPANFVYMTKKGELIIDLDTPFRNTHAHSKISKDEKVPVMGFYFVDVYSKAYFVHYIATKGESIANYIEAFTQFFLYKKNHPMGGTIDRIYTDRGSALHSAALRGFLESASPGVKIDFHKPKNPQSKGPVEARIGANQKIFEAFLKSSDFHTIEELNAISLEFQIYNQAVVTDKFQKYIEGLSKRKDPVRTISNKNLSDASTCRFKRKVDAYRCISIDAKSYLVPVDVAKGQEIDVFVRGENYYTLLDGKILQLSDRGPMTYDDPEAHRIPERIQRVNHIKKNANKFVEEFHKTPSYDFSNLENLEAPKGESFSTHSIVPPLEFETVKEAVTYIVQETGMDEAEFVEEYIEIVEKIQSKFGRIEGSVIRGFVERIIKADSHE
jgi:transposase InsO family protein